MEFDQNNKVVQLCAKGMKLEAQGLAAQASALFNEAWDAADSDFEKFTSAHYVARHQENIVEKLKWDEMALDFALKINDDAVKQAYPSLYLNIAKCYEDAGELSKARKNYELALSFCDSLPENGYGNMIKSGVLSGLERVKR